LSIVKVIRGELDSTATDRFIYNAIMAISSRDDKHGPRGKGIRISVLNDDLAGPMGDNQQLMPVMPVLGRLYIRDTKPFAIGRANQPCLTVLGVVRVLSGMSMRPHERITIKIQVGARIRCLPIHDDSPVRTAARI